MFVVIITHSLLANLEKFSFLFCFGENNSVGLAWTFGFQMLFFEEGVDLKDRRTNTKELQGRAEANRRLCRLEIGLTKFHESQKLWKSRRSAFVKSQFPFTSAQAQSIRTNVPSFWEYWINEVLKMGQQTPNPIFSDSLPSASLIDCSSLQDS